MRRGAHGRTAAARNAFESAGVRAVLCARNLPLLSGELQLQVVVNEREWA
jgi:hypothetical protein